jgi:DNA-directed RNA polymerase specialized sigma24 family protein
MGIRAQSSRPPDRCVRDSAGLCYRQIAYVPGCPIGTAMSRLHRAGTHLLQQLYEHIGELTA